ncbi:hypothetical protein UlMin_014925 [Ulmus minor]
MNKRTKKAGIIGKYGTRYGASLHKQIKKMEVSWWHCKDCNSTASAVMVRSTIQRLME